MLQLLCSKRLCQLCSVVQAQLPCSLGFLILVPARNGNFCPSHLWYARNELVYVVRIMISPASTPTRVADVFMQQTKPASPDRAARPALPSLDADSHGLAVAFWFLHRLLPEELFLRNFPRVDTRHNGKVPSRFKSGERCKEEYAPLFYYQRSIVLKATNRASVIMLGSLCIHGRQQTGIKL